MWIWGGHSAQLLPACSLRHSAFPWHSPAAMEGSACVPLYVPSPAAPFLVSIQVSWGLFQPLQLEQRGLRWQSFTDCGKLGLARGLHGAAGVPWSQQAQRLAPCSEPLPSALAGVLEPRVPQIMSPAPQLQPDPLVALLSCAHQLGSGLRGTQIQPLQWRKGRAGWSGTRLVSGMLSKGAGSGTQVSGGVPAPALPCSMRSSTVLFIWRGPKMLPGQAGGSAQSWELHVAAWEPLSSRLDPGGALQLGVPCPTGPARRGSSLLGQPGCGFAVPITRASALWAPGLI